MGADDTTRLGTPSYRLKPWTTLRPAEPLPPLTTFRELPRGPERLERLGATLGQRLVKKLRLQVERDSEASDEEDPIGSYYRKKLRRELAVEACGALMGQLAPALSDGDLSGADLGSFADATRRIGRNHAEKAGTRGSYTEAAYLALAGADLAEGMVDIANDPGGYLDRSLAFTKSFLYPAEPPRARADGLGCRDQKVSGLIVSQRCVWSLPFVSVP